MVWRVSTKQVFPSIFRPIEVGIGKPTLILCLLEFLFMMRHHIYLQTRQTDIHTTSLNRRKLWWREIKELTVSQSKKRVSWMWPSNSLTQYPHATEKNQLINYCFKTYLTGWCFQKTFGSNHIFHLWFLIQNSKFPTKSLIHVFLNHSEYHWLKWFFDKVQLEKMPSFGRPGHINSQKKIII